MGMRKKPAVPLTQKFPKAEPLALKLLERLLAFDPKDRPSAEEVRTRYLLILLTNFIHASVNVTKLHYIFLPNVHEEVTYIPAKWEYQHVSSSFFRRICGR